MKDATLALIRRWATQDGARTNAAQASEALHRRRRELDEADAYVARIALQRDGTHGGDHRQPRDIRLSGS